MVRVKRTKKFSAIQALNMAYNISEHLDGKHVSIDCDADASFYANNGARYTFYIADKLMVHVDRWVDIYPLYHRALEL